ncbi:MAG: pyridoxamine 5'-phosphate oxidase family protein [Anaerolineaceae bacterium]|nr:pyridoxamine 5'-phosphate oxidase family protein [Anaerolineaceae bacterium]
MEVTDFSEIQAEFEERVQAVIYCMLVTTDHNMRPRSRVVHPVWEGATGWVTSRRHSPKAQHLEYNPYVSVAYLPNPAKPVYAECIASWEDDREEKARIWAFLKATPAPYGFDPGTIFSSVDDPKYGLLKLTPWRIEVPSIPNGTLIWRGSN